MSDLDAVLALTPRTTRLRDRESAKRAKRADIATPNQREKATPSPFDRANPPLKKVRGLCMFRWFVVVMPNAFAKNCFGAFG